MPTSGASDCLFCGIVAGDVPSERVFEDDLTYAFRDIKPAAPVHVLVVPREHVEHLGALVLPLYGAARAPAADHATHLAAMVRTVQAVAEQEGIADDGYRVVANVGAHGGMTVDHLHFHVLGGRPLRWPPE